MQQENNIDMKKLLFTLLLITASVGAFAQSGVEKQHEVLFTTSMGDIRVVLYNETPKHRDNFLKLVKEGYYDGNLWHRVISNFMIQSGDSTSRHAPQGKLLGEYSPDYVIPAEIVFPKYFHKRGALAAAREGDDVNPNYDSSASQFYIVWGRRFNDDMLDAVEDRIDRATHGKVKLTPEVREYYKIHGGTPHLDGQYTVFGEVIEGLDVVQKIQAVETDSNNRPVEDVKIIKTVAY